MKATTKVCPYCEHTVLREFRSLNQKQCDDCLKWFDWHLDPGQKPLLGPSRSGAGVPVLDDLVPCPECETKRFIRQQGITLCCSRCGFRAGSASQWNNKAKSL